MKKLIVSILVISSIFAALAGKLSYYYLAEKNGAFIKKVSISRQMYASMASDGWKFHAYPDAAAIPQNPVLDGGAIREMTAAEITAAAIAAARARKLARSKFTKLEIREAFKASGKETDLDTLLDNSAQFKKYWLDATEIDLAHPVTAAALANFTPAEINAIKLVIP